MSKTTIVTALVLLNVLLAVCLVGKIWRQPAAFAQPVGLSGNFIAVAGEVKGARDGLFLIDLENRYLHMLLYDRSTGTINYVDGRSLARDFGALPVPSPEAQRGGRRRR